MELRRGVKRDTNSNPNIAVDITLEVKRALGKDQTDSTFLVNWNPYQNTVKIIGPTFSFLENIDDEDVSASPRTKAIVTASEIIFSLCI